MILVAQLSPPHNLYLDESRKELCKAGLQLVGRVREREQRSPFKETKRVLYFFNYRRGSVFLSRVRIIGWREFIRTRMLSWLMRTKANE